MIPLMAFVAFICIIALKIIHKKTEDKLLRYENMYNYVLDHFYHTGTITKEQFLKIANMSEIERAKIEKDKKPIWLEPSYKEDDFDKEMRGENDE